MAGVGGWGTSPWGGSGERPLTGMSVVELQGDVATRYCGRLLAWAGATVTAVGARRDDGIGYGGTSGTAYGRWLDEGKVPVASVEEASLEVDLVVAGQSDDAVTAAAALLPPGGDGPVLLGIRWFDPSGPYGGWRGTDELVHALTGVAYSFGLPDGPPTVPQGHGPQVVAGANAYAIALAALVAPPDRRPSLVETTVHESFMCVAEVAAIAAVDDESARSVRLGVNRFVPTYPCSSYPTEDGWAGLTCLTPAQWTAMCTSIEREDVLAERRFSTSFRRLLAGDEVDGLLRPPFSQRTTAAWVQEGMARRIPISPMSGPGGLLQEPHWVDRGAFAPVAGAGASGPTPPFRFRFDGVRPEPSPPPDDGGEAGPLAGLRVVDFTMGWAGPQATRFLADLGADVVKVESRGHPDWYRGWEADQGGDPPAIELRSNFNALNRGKRGVALDLTSEEGLRQARGLLADADVVVESFAAGVLDRLGLGQAVQRELRPGVISLSMPAFGNGGPLSAVRAYGSTVEQASGLPFVNGEASWDPCLQHVAIGDPVAGVFAAAAVLTALAGRRSLGGADIDLAQVQCLFQLGADAVIEEQVTGRPVPRTGSQRARHGVACARAGGGDDKWLVVVTPDDAARAALEEVVGRVGAVPEDVQAALGTWAAGRSAGEGASALQSAGVPAAAVRPASSLGRDPQLVASGFWQTLERRHVGRHTLGAPAFRLDGARPAPRRPAPTLGEHTEEVLGQLGPS